MDANPVIFFIFLLFLLNVCISGSIHVKKKGFRAFQHDVFNPTFSTIPAAPVGINPVTVASPFTFPPATTVANPTLPVTNPVTTPSAGFPGGQPVNNNNPVITYPAPANNVPFTSPVAAQPVNTNAPAVPGQSWCLARNGVPESSIQAAIDYACGIGGADCSAIQQGAACFIPNTMENHASYAFNSYYQRNPAPTSCDFGGTAFITNTNPSSASCIYPTWSSSSTSPNTLTPVTTNPASIPTTPSSSQTNPAILGTPPTTIPSGNPVFGDTSSGFGEIPPMANASSISASNRLQPFGGFIVLMTAGNFLWEKLRTESIQFFH